ncbi:hypothetical protein OE88DRAFT_1354846 [Heliocybe sulcata]|uniref:Uncharacterized protein n=1 Tax=Heliocybe sulcata TaxID=5364 RepID=A0A5C3N5W7_9AGAM|nr:hypothetical protein OE88DRAFT_1354846 [Heliocybe sulcata]
MISQEARLASDEERVAAVEGKLRGYEVEDAVGNRILDALKEELTMMQRGWEEIRQGVLDLRSELCKPADQSSLATFWQEFIQVRDRVLPYVMRAEEEELAARKSAADTEKVAGSLQTREADGEQGTHRVDSDERGALETHAGGEQRNVGPMQILNDPSTESARIWRAWE